MNFFSQARKAFLLYVPIIIIHYILLLFFRLWQAFSIAPGNETGEVLIGYAGDLILINVFLLVLFVPFFIITRINERLAVTGPGILSILFYLFLFPLYASFLLAQSHEGISTIPTFGPAYRLFGEHFASAGILIPLALFLLLATGLYFLLLMRALKLPAIAGSVSAILLILSLPLSIELGFNSDFFSRTEFRHNPSFQFMGQAVGFQFPDTIEETEISSRELFYATTQEKLYVEQDDYPLLRKQSTEDCLGGFFKTTSPGQLPDIIVIMIEGWSHAYLRPQEGVVLMPNLHRLSEEGLYWSNYLSTSSGNQNALGSLLGALPYGREGFSVMPVLPRHFSLVNILRQNGYFTAYYSGRHGWVQSADKLFSLYNTDHVSDISSFPPHYNRLSTSAGTPWGYHDKDLVAKLLERRSTYTHQPSLEIIQSAGILHPLLPESEQRYDARFRELSQSPQSPFTPEFLENHKQQVLSMMLTDEAIGILLEELNRNNRLDNTIIAITGNYPDSLWTHSNNGLEKYHVPLVIYSPMLTEARQFDQIASHADFFESFTTMLAGTFGVKLPEYTTSLGQSLCKSGNESVFIPFMDKKNQISELLHGDYFLAADSALYRVEENLTLSPVNLPGNQQELMLFLEAFNKVNLQASSKLLPDSLYFEFLNYEAVADTLLSAARIRNEYMNIIKSLPLEKNTVYHLDIALTRPQLSLEEVYVVYDISDEDQQVVQWKNYGIPSGGKDFGVQKYIQLPDTSTGNYYLRVFLWNESPVPYSFEGARVTLLKKPARDARATQLE